MIRVQGLHFSYQLAHQQRLEAVRGLNLEIAQAEWVAILGANASGKTTLGKLLCGVLLPSGGEVWLAGVNTKQHDNSARPAVGLVLSRPEEQLLTPTVEEEVAFGPENLGLTVEEISARIREALNWLGLGDYAPRPISDLCAGEQQRVVLASVLATKPRCLVLDEPTAFLSPHQADQLRQRVHWLNQEQGVTIIWLSQRVEEARGASRVLVLHQGRLCVDDTPARIFSDTYDWEGWGLELPPVLRLAQALVAEGFALTLPTFTVDELLKNLASLKATGVAPL